MNNKLSVVNRPILVTVTFCLLVFLGSYLATQLGIALYPDINEPSLIVFATYPNTGPGSVEQSVTKPLESALENINGIKKMTSVSSSGTSQIEIKFDYGKNLESATNEIRDALGSVAEELPKGMKPPQIYKFATGSMPIIDIAIRGQRSPEEIRQIVKNKVVNKLRRIEGVADATVAGGRVAAVRVDIAQERLDAYGLTLTSVSESLAAQNIELGGGKITEKSHDFVVKTIGTFHSIEEIANSVIALKPGYGIKLRDVATVTMGLKDEDSSVLINGESGIYLSVKKKSGGNTVKIAKEVLAALPEIQGTLPADIKLELLNDDSQQILSTQNTLVRSAIEAIVLAMLVIFFFLRSAKTTLIIGLSIPISIATTLLVMYFLGLSLNIFTMTGLILGVGMIVDDSIVIMENIVRYRERGMKNRIAAIIGSQEMKQAVIASTLTTILVFVPFLIFKNKLGSLGILFQDMLITIVISMLSSLAVALFLVPVLISKYFPLVNRLETPLGNPLLRSGDRMLELPVAAMSRGYRWALGKVMNNRLTLLLVVCLLLVLSVGQMKHMSLEFAPDAAQQSVTLNVALPVGTSFVSTKKVLQEMDAIARREIIGNITVITSVGTDSNGNAGSVQINLPGKKGQAVSKIKIKVPPGSEKLNDSEAVKEMFRRHYQDYPAARFTFASDMESQLSGASAAINIKIESDDLEPAIRTARKLVDLIKKEVNTATDVAMDVSLGLPQVEVVIDRQKAASLGVDVATIATEINANVSGVVTTQYRHNGNDYDIFVVLRESDRHQIVDLNRIHVSAKNGARISLANLVELKKGTGPVSIAHQNKSRIVRVTANTTSGASIPVVEGQIKAAIAHSVVVDPMVKISYEGEQAAIEAMGGTMLVVIIMAIILIFGVMAAQYESIKDPIINLFTIPLMLIGVVGIYRISGQAISMFTALGLLMLIGIVVKNGIVMVDCTNLLRARGMSVREACIEAGVIRLRPVLMTSLTAILSMIPLALNHGDGGEMVQPIGLTVIGGLTSSTVMTLFVIPAIYSLLNKDKKETKEASDAAS